MANIDADKSEKNFSYVWPAFQRFKSARVRISHCVAPAWDGPLMVESPADTIGVGGEVS